MNLMALRDPRQSPRGQEKAQAIVTKSAHHFFFPTCLASWPWPRVASFILQSSVLPPSDFDITVKIQTKTSLQKWFSSCGHTTFWTKKGLCWWICPHESSCALPMCLSPFSLACACTDTHTHTHIHTHTHTHLFGTESPRNQRHRLLFYVWCQTGAKTICSYS